MDGLNAFYTHPLTPKRQFLVLACLFLTLQPVWAQILQTSPEDGDSTRAPSPPRVTQSVFVPQKYLVLDKPGRIKRLRFFVGNEITFRLKGDRLVYQEFITAVDDSSFTIYGTKVPLRDVDRIIVRNQGWFLNQGAVYLPLAGLLYFLADNINPTLHGGESFKVSRSSVIVGASLISVGVVLRIFQKRQHKIGHNKRLRVLETF